MVKISAFIIAKNEEARIETALNSLVSFCDEIVVVDTGSTDRTKEIALNYTDKIFDFEWIDDFAAARNFALSKCSGDWILFLDADDEITPAMQARMKKAIGEATDEDGVILVSYRYSRKVRQLVPRVFRSALGLKFVSPIHEHLDTPKNVQAKMRVHNEIEIVHHKTEEEANASNERNLRILRRAVAAEPEDFNLKFHLGRELYNAGNFDEALEVLLPLFEKGLKDKSFKYGVALYIGRTYKHLEKFKEALECFGRAREMDARFAEPLVFAGDVLLYGLKNPEEAKKFYEESLAVPMPGTSIPVNPDFYHAYPASQLKKLENLKKPMALVCGYYGRDNIGDEMMLASLIQNMPQYRIVVASYDPGRTQKLHGVEAVPHKHEHFGAAMEQAALVIIGGGTLFHDQGLTESTAIEYYCSIINEADGLGKRVVILGAGVDDVKLQANRDLIARAFAKCERIVVRDEDSRKRLVEYGVSRETEVLPDLSFGLDIYVKAEKRARSLVGINLCPPQKNDSFNVKKNIEELLVPFINGEDFDYIFIPGREDDKQMMSLIGEDVNCFQPRDESYFEDYIKVTGSCDYLIASRYHMVLLGLICRVQIFVISYADKTEALLKDFGGAVKRFSGSVEKLPPFDVDPMRAQVKRYLKAL